MGIRQIVLWVSLLPLGAIAQENTAFDDVKSCVEMAKGGFREFHDDRTERFLGKVTENSARCRGGERAAEFRGTPWVDWSNYWATGDATTMKEGSEAKTVLGEHLKPNGRGIDGSLIDLEYQRIELIKFNLFDNYTYETYIKGLGGQQGVAVKQWEEMRLPVEHPNYVEVGGEGDQQCAGDLIRNRTLTGICNDINNPKMGSTNTYFSRNVAFDSTFPSLGKNALARNRHMDSQHGMRIGVLKPDPQLISRRLFTRLQQDEAACNQGQGRGGDSVESHCDYQQVPFFNVLAAFWIQFMTHDWFSHLDEGHNQSRLMPVGCPEDQAAQLGCRPLDQIEPSLFAIEDEAESFNHGDNVYLKRSHKVTQNTVTAWWDASQIYGYNEKSQKRVVRDPQDAARLLQDSGYLPLFKPCSVDSDLDCVLQPQWHGQEATAFPDNWNIGLSFYHNLFVREHNSFVDHFRSIQRDFPEQDSGLRDPLHPDRVITYAEVSDDELYQAGRLVVSAMIAKIHTIEWTTQLLYDEPLYKAMNSNWFGLFNLEEDDVSAVLRKMFNQDKNFLSRISSRMARMLGMESEDSKSHGVYSVLASGAGIFGLNNSRNEGLWWWKHDAWDVSDPTDVNGGINHFGSPFNFPEEFTSVYRLHPLLPDLLEYREWQQPNVIKSKVPVVDTVRGRASSQIRSKGLENWGLSMGRQRLGFLHLNNHPQFLQNLDMPHLNSPTKKIDVAALDLIRDRERGIPRFNEFRRQIGLKSLRSFDDFVDQRQPKDSSARKRQEETIQVMREIYGTHICDASKPITDVQKDGNGEFINDCHGFPDGSEVDNIEDVDVVVGWLAEYTRPHGFAISETQFHIFIINASRRLFSDRFFTSSFRPEFYSKAGYDWVVNNGPLDDCPYPLEELKDGGVACNEPVESNGHKLQVAPLKRTLIRNIPELRDELMPVVNTFDSWARDRGNYYSLDWKPRTGAESDPSFTR
ncbi:MAG: peroxidase family protein [bacterium]